MFFKRKGYLRNEVDNKLHEKTDVLKSEWNNIRRINDISFSFTPELNVEERIAEQKYFTVFRELKYRKSIK